MKVLGWAFEIWLMSLEDLDAERERETLGVCLQGGTT